MGEQISSSARWMWRPGTTTLLTLACALAQASFGYESTIGAVAPNELTSSFDLDVPLSYGSAQFGGGFTITFGVASVVGAIATIFLGEPLGRKKSVAIGAATSLLGCILQVAGAHLVVFSLGRVLSGLGCGFNSANAPVWQVEAVETRLRGRLILLQLVAKAIGAMVASWVVLAYSPEYLSVNTSDPEGYNVTNAVPWRLPIGMQMVLSTLLLLLIPQLPESPRWLLRRGRITQATQTVSQLLHRSIDDPHVQHFIDELSSPSEYGYETPYQTFKGMWATCCSRRRKAEIPPPRQVKRWRRLGLGSSLQFLAQWSGYAAFQLSFTKYSPSGQRARDVFQYSSLTWYAACAALSIAFVESLGRRRSLMTAFAGQACCGLVLSGLLSIPRPSTSLRHLGLAFSALGQCFCGFNYGLPWLYQLEVNAWSLRLVGTAAAQVVQFLGSITLVYGWWFATNYTRILFVAPILVSLFAVSVVFLLYPETTGRTPQDLDHYYSNGPSVWVWKQLEATRVQPRSPEGIFVADVTESKEVRSSTREVLVSATSSEEIIASPPKAWVS